MIVIDKSREFLEDYLDLLEEMSNNSSFLADKKFLAQLRLAERSFNFLLDFLSMELEYKIFETDKIEAIKSRRDKLAEKISQIIETDDEAKKRYEILCDNLKDLKRIGAFL